MALPRLKAPAINRKFLVPAGTVLVLVVLALGVVGYQRSVNIRHAEAVQAKLQNDMAAKATQTKISGLEAQVSTLTADKKVICQYVDGVQKARQTKGLILLPVAAHCVL